MTSLHHVFAIHNEIGRFFDESIYKRELAFRMPNVRLEEPIDVAFDSFRKRYFLDVLVGNSGIFEFKCAKSLAARHRAQLLNYLQLCNVTHGKLINIRSDEVTHEFVNSQLKLDDRTRFEVCLARWQALLGAERLPEVLVPLLRELGTGLEIAFYEEAVAHFLDGAAQMETMLDVQIKGRSVGQQRFRMLTPQVAIKITAFDSPLEAFESHARKLLAHTELRAIAWINIHHSQVTFITLR